MSFENTIIHGMTSKEYHRHPAISRSKLMDYSRSPYIYQYKHVLGLSQKEPTQAMIEGSLVHTLCLEPENFEKEYRILSYDSYRTEAAKEEKQAILADNPDVTVITMGEYNKAKNIADNLMQNVDGIFDGAYIESSLFWTDPITGLQCKSRPDAYKGSFVIDLKTTSQFDYHHFQKECLNFGYFMQAGMIYEASKVINGEPFKNFVILVIEKTEPYRVAKYPLDDLCIQYGIDDFRTTLDSLALAIEKNEYPGKNVVQFMHLPNWAREKLGIE